MNEDGRANGDEGGEKGIAGADEGDGVGRFVHAAAVSILTME